jgi:hypothetical protein
MADKDPEELPYLGNHSAAEMLQLADVALVCKDGELAAHKAFLAKGSKVGACATRSMFKTMCRATELPQAPFEGQEMRVPSSGWGAGCKSPLPLPLTGARHMPPPRHVATPRQPACYFAMPNALHPPMQVLASLFDSMASSGTAQQHGPAGSAQQDGPPS